jgi:LPXTG-motif cell wall-anchored protein
MSTHLSLSAIAARNIPDATADASHAFFLSVGVTSLIAGALLLVVYRKQACLY